MSKGPSLFVRLTIYPLVAISFLVIVFLVVISAAGYQVEYKDGKLQTKETGIIIINTKPGESDVYLDGELYRKKTPSFAFFDLKINRVSAGSHNLKIAKDGYEVWEGDVNVTPGLVTWVNYLLLAPLERNSEEFVIGGDIKNTITSYDKKKQLVYSYDEEEKVNIITEINTTSKEKRGLYEFYSTDASSYSLVSYSHDGERFLLRKVLEEEVSYVVYESKESGKSWSLTSLFALKPDALVFSPYNHDKIYGLKNSNLYELDFVNEVQSAIVANNVSSVHYDSEQFMFVQDSDENHSLWKLDSSNNKEQIIKALPASEKYGVSYLDRTNDYLILAVDESDLIKYSNGESNPTLETIASDVSSYTLSPSEERVGYTKGSDYMVYDFEEEEYFSTLTGKKVQKVTWLYNNGNLMYMDEEEKIYMVNYDGKYNKYLFDANKDLPIISVPESFHIFFGTEKTQAEEENTLEISVFTFSS